MKNNNSSPDETRPGPSKPPKPHSLARRILFWTLLVGSVVGSIWWINWFPFHVDRLYSVIPPDATVIVEHRQLAARWPELARNPLVRNLVASTANAHGQFLHRSLDDPETALWIQRLAGRHAVLAYVPYFDGSPDDAWVMASWVGSFAHQMRWNMLWNRTGDGQTLDLGRGERGWIMANEYDGTGKTLSLALVDGVLLACWSKNPEGVRILAQRKKWGAEPAEALREKLARRQTEAEPHPRFGSAPDRGWLRSLAPQSRRHAAHPVRLAVTDLDAHSVAGWFGFESDRAPGPSADEPPAIDTGNPTFLKALENILGASPAALTVLPLGQANRLVLQQNTKPAWQTLGALLTDAAGEHAPCFVSVCRPEYAGRILGFRTPGIVMGLHLDKPEKGRHIVAATLDILNAGLGLGLILKDEVGMGGQNLMVVESANADAFLGLTPSERPTFAVSGNWLLFAANRSIMEKLCESWLIRSHENRPAAWRTAIEGRPSTAFAWLDFDATHTAAIRSKAVYGLMALVVQFPADHAIRQTLDALAMFTDAARPLESGVIWRDDAKRGTGFEFLIGMVLGTGVEPAQP